MRAVASSQDAMRGRRAVAALEFGLAAPILLTLIWGSYDVSRALVAWEETYHAAEAIAQAAEKMSVTGSNNPVTGAPILALTSQRMQDAMTTIYAEMPFLNLGNTAGSFGGQFSVTLSGVTYLPPCQANAHGPSACILPQIPQVIWSAYLVQGGAQLLTPPSTPAAMLLRACGTPGVVGGSFPNNGNQLATLVDVNKAGAGGTAINMLPQVVADVRYVFTPTFPLLRQSYTFWASASFPAPLGGDDQPIVFDLTHSIGSITAVLSCLASSVYGGPV